MTDTTSQPAPAGDASPPQDAPRRGVPDPGIPLPRVAWPTVGLFFGTLAVWVAATGLVLAGFGGWWLALTIPLHTAVSFAMFTVLHEAVHFALGRRTWVSAVLGRLSMPFVVAYAGFGLFRFIHIEHHRNTNEDKHVDPDAWTEEGPAWALPLRWLTVDLWYVRFYLPRMPRRPRAEVVESLGVFAAAAGIFAAVIATGNLWQLAVIYLIPQRLALGILAWWFDWLPHHDLTLTAARNRFRATRVRVGLEWLMNPLMLYQNYHVVHHLHPSIPFYQYVQAWRRNEREYLARDVPIASAWGGELTAAEYRQWQDIVDTLESEQHDGAGRSRFYRLRIAEVTPLTGHSVALTFQVADDLRGVFAFAPGQHVPVRAEIDGAPVRRTYSLCAPADARSLRVAVKHHPGGVFSGWATTALRAGDTLEVMPPAGRFTRVPHPGTAKHYGMLAAGSGITPLLSILASVLRAEADSTVTLLYANRSAETTMFGAELSRLANEFDGRLAITHARSRDDGALPGSAHEQVISGRLDADALAAQLASQPGLAAADDWYLCGPQALTDTATEVLSEHGVAGERIHRELFTVDTAPAASPEAAEHAVPATITATLDGQDTAIETAGVESVLEAALRSGLDAPYSCTGGVCATCRATLVSGTVAMENNVALDEADQQRGWVLTCQSRPTSPVVHVDYDR